MYPAYIYMGTMYRRFGGCASSFGRPPDREVGFVSFVRASGRGEAACLREGDYVSLRWPTDSGILFRFGSAYRLLCFTWVSSIFHDNYCHMHGFDVVMFVCMILAWVS